MMLEVLVTGAGGQVGTELVALDGEAVAVRGLGSEGLDITREDEVRRCIGDAAPKAVINCAAFTAVDAAEDQADEAYLVNAVGARHVADACARARIPLIHISTDYVFDGSHDAPIDEAADPAPINVYGASKLAGERAVAAAGGRYAIVRAGWIFGRLARGFVHTMLGLAATREVLTVVDDQLGTPCYAGDLAAALVALAKRLVEDPGVGGIFHYSCQPPTSWFGFASTIVEAAKSMGVLPPHAAEVRPITSAEYPTRAARPRYSVLDGGRLNSLLGPAPDWRMGLDRCLRDRQAPVGC